MDFSTVITFIKQIVATFTALISMFMPAADTASVAYGAENLAEHNLVAFGNHDISNGNGEWINGLTCPIRSANKYIILLWQIEQKKLPQEDYILI